MKVSHKHILFIGLLMNISFSNSCLANTETIDADFLEFLVEMEEITGSGFNSWLEDTSEEANFTTPSIPSNTENNEQILQSNSNENN